MRSRWPSLERTRRAASPVADVRRRRCGPDRCRDGRPDRRAVAPEPCGTTSARSTRRPRACPHRRRAAGAAAAFSENSRGAAPSTPRDARRRGAGSTRGRRHRRGARWYRRGGGDVARGLDAAYKVWAAGVGASPLAAQLAEEVVAPRRPRRADRACSPTAPSPGHPEVFVVGDMMSLDFLPGVAQVAMQGGQHAADTIKARIAGDPRAWRVPVHDKGSMAVISRNKAVAKVGELELTGYAAWMAWLFVHLVYLVGLKNRFTTLVSWFVDLRGTRPAAAVGHLPADLRAARDRAPGWARPASGGPSSGTRLRAPPSYVRMPPRPTGRAAARPLRRLRPTSAGLLPRVARTHGSGTALRPTIGQP